MAASQAMCTSFKVEILNGIHAFGTTVVRAATTADTFKIALYTSSSTNGAATATYTTTNEITNTSGTAYTAGGATLTAIAPTSTGTTAFTDFNDTTFSTASFTANSALIYNFTQGGASGKAVAVLAFGADKTASAGTFTIIYPTADATNAIIRIA
jgi:hypothetical protein